MFGSRGLFLLFVLVFIENLFAPGAVILSQLTQELSRWHKCVDDTVLGSYIVGTVPWEVQVSVSGFSVHPYCEYSICFWSDDSIPEKVWSHLLLPPLQ